MFLSTLSNENNPNLSQVQEKAQLVRQQGAASKGRSNYLNCCHCGSVLAALPIARWATLLAAQIPTVARFQHFWQQAEPVSEASSPAVAVPVAGAQLPVRVRMLVGVRVRFGL